MRRQSFAAIGAFVLLGLCGSVVSSQQAGQGRGGAPAPAVPNLSTDKTMFWRAADIQARWKDNETLKAQQLPAVQRTDQHQRERPHRFARRRAVDP